MESKEGEGSDGGKKPDENSGGDPGTSKQTQEPEFMKDPAIRDFLKNAVEKGIESGLDKRVSEAVKTNTEKLTKKLADQSAAEKKQAEDAALAAQGEFKKLAEQREMENNTLKGQLADLTKAKEESAKLMEVIEKSVKAEIESLKLSQNNPIMDLLSKLPILEQSQWIAEHRAALLKSDSGFPGLPGEREPGVKKVEPNIPSIKSFG